MFNRVLVQAMIPQWPLLGQADRRQAAKDAGDFVLQAIAASPFHIRVGISIASLVVGGATWIISIGAGGPLCRSFRANRLYQVLQKLPGPLPSVIRLYRSMTLLAYYDHPRVSEKLLVKGPLRPMEAGHDTLG